MLYNQLQHKYAKEPVLIFQSTTAYQQQVQTSHYLYVTILHEYLNGNLRW